MYGVIAVLFAILIAIFSVQNATPVSVNFLFWKFENISLVLVIIASAIIGGLIVFFVSLFKTFSLKRKLSSVLKEKIALEQQLDRFEQTAPTAEE